MRRLFVDPASRSAGWTLFEGENFVASGTVLASGKDGFARLVQIYEGFQKVRRTYNPEEVHIEKLNYGVNYMCLWSVGVIGLVFAMHLIPVEQDIVVTSWQAYSSWKLIAEDWRKVNDPTKFDSEDAWAAFWMGNFFLSKLGGKSK